MPCEGHDVLRVPIRHASPHILNRLLGVTLLECLARGLLRPVLAVAFEGRRGFIRVAGRVDSLVFGRSDTVRRPLRDALPSVFKTDTTQSGAIVLNGLGRGHRSRMGAREDARLKQILRALLLHDTGGVVRLHMEWLGRIGQCLTSVRGVCLARNLCSGNLREARLVASHLLRILGIHLQAVGLSRRTSAIALAQLDSHLG